MPPKNQKESTNMADLLGMSTIPSEPLPEVPAVESGPQLGVDFIEATFAGNYFKGSAGGNTLEHYELTVKVPIDWLERDDFNAPGVFRALYANRPTMLGGKPGFSGIETCVLKRTSELPRRISEKAFLKWCVDVNELKRYIDDLRMPIELDLYADAQELRFAIESYKREPGVFIEEQKRRRGSAEHKKQMMAAQLDALGI